MSQSQKATVRQRSTVLETPSTTLPKVLAQQHRKHISKSRAAAIDLRIGLNMLGIEGRKLLIEYILLKRQGRGD